MKILREADRPVRDYTKARLGSLTGNGRRKVERCPECGEKGEAVTYRGGDRNFVHRRTSDGLGWSTTAGVDSHFIPTAR